VFTMRGQIDFAFIQTFEHFLKEKRTTLPKPQLDEITGPRCPGTRQQPLTRRTYCKRPGQCRLTKRILLPAGLNQWGR
jgi:hypothetical protein